MKPSFGIIPVPVDDGPAILEAILARGSEFGLLLGGSRAYSTVSPESGWIPSPMPAIYSGEKMKPYREWLPADGFEANASLGGSFYSPDIEDTLRVYSNQLGHGERCKYMEMPNAYYSILPFDKVLAGDRMIGLSTYTVYTANVRGWFSLAMLDEEIADGSEVTVVWGEEDGGSSKPIVERHIQTEIRATVSYNRLNED